MSRIPGCSWGVDLAGDFAPEFFAGLHFSYDFMGPFMGDIAVGTAGANAGAIAVVNGGFQFLEDIVVHFMAAGAKRFRITGFHKGIEAAPEDNVGGEAKGENDP